MYAEYGKKEDMDNSYRYYRMEDFLYDYTFKDIYMFQDIPKSMKGMIYSYMCKISTENASQGRGIGEGRAIMERTPPHPHPSPHNFITPTLPPLKRI